jgi:two-component system, sensor histidine kinase RetS
MPEQPTQHNLIQMTLFVTLALLINTGVHCGEITLDHTLNRLELDNQLHYLFDEQQILDVSQVAQQNSNLPWQPGTMRHTELLMPAGLYWIKGRLINPLEHPVSVTLEVKPSSIRVVDLYLVEANGDITPVYANAGLNDAFTNRPSQHRNLINTLTINARGSLTLIWRVEDAPKLQFKAVVWNPTHFFQEDQHIQLVHGMLYGIILVMGLYNLFLFTSTQEKSYLYYVLFIATAGYLLAAEEGHIYYYIGTEQSWPKFAVYTLIYSLNLLIFGQFCIHFLRLQKYSVLLLRAIRMLSISSAVLVLISAASNVLPVVIISLLAVTALYILALASGVHVRSRGVISAGHFVIAIMILVFSMVATTMATFGLIESNSFTQSLSAMGTTMMLIFFSLALADRINQLQKENLEASDGINRANNEKLRAMAELKSSQGERIKLEQSANQAKAESRSKSTFLANLSHEIRTPMNGVLGTTELMKSTSLTERQEHYLHTIEQSGQTLLSIIESLQDYAKIEAGRMPSEFVSFNLEALLDSCISTFALKSTEKNIEFIADLDPSIEPVLRGDLTKLQQIILNLLSNAFKFTDSGNVVLRVKTTDKSAVNRVELKFEIRDTGIGLSKEEQERLFSPFQHADESTYGRYGGSGLGLAISKQLAELMDGQIGVRSTPGEGSCFWFTARLMIDSKPDPTLLRKRSSHLVGQRVLLVDSNELASDVISRILDSWAIEVDTVKNKEQAINDLLAAQSAANPFSIILSQYQLEDGNALSLADEISSSTQLSPTSFIVMATSKQVAKEDALLGTGVDLLLEKPLTFDRLHGVLKNAVTAPKEQSLPNTREQHSTTDKARVLLVEDNPVNQMVLSGLLSALGICPKIATDGLQAVEMVQADTYDIVFMDCEMPAMDGFEATTRIRTAEQQTQKPPLTIVALSAHSTTQHQQQAQRCGMDDYLVKPVSVADLRTVVEAALAQNHKNHETRQQQTNI